MSSVIVRSPSRLPFAVDSAGSQTRHLAHVSGHDRVTQPWCVPWPWTKVDWNMVCSALVPRELSPLAAQQLSLLFRTETVDCCYLLQPPTNLIRGRAVTKPIAIFGRSGLASP